MKETKLIDDKRQRSEIIHDNFFKYLKKRKISQSKYAFNSKVSESTISKWKNNSSHMNEEHIKQAADILEITVNDLFYSDEEKKKISVLRDSPYEPIMANQQIQINMMQNFFKNPTMIFSNTILLSIIIAIIMLFVTKYSPYWCLLGLYIPLFACKDFKYVFSNEKTYSINYLDDVYYYITNEKNQHFTVITLLHSIQTMLLIICFVKIIPFVSESTSFSDVYFLFSIADFIIVIVSVITLLIFNEKYLKQKIYDNEIRGYLTKLVNMYSNAILIIFASSILAVAFNDMWYIIFMVFFSFGLSILEFVLTSKKYSEYKMVYEAFEREPRELFPNNYKN